MIAVWWSVVLTVVGATGMWLAGRRSWAGWAVGLGAQALWLAYAIATRQWGFLASCAIYGFTYATNLRRWLRERSNPDLPESIGWTGDLPPDFDD